MLPTALSNDIGSIRQRMRVNLTLGVQKRREDLCERLLDAALNSDDVLVRAITTDLDKLDLLMGNGTPSQSDLFMNFVRRTADFIR